MKATDADASFLSRWARRKEQARAGVPVAPEAPVLPVPVDAPVAKQADTAPAREEAPQAEPLPTLADVALLTRESDYSRFVAAGVDDGVKRAAMRKLFTDPHFNVMDGLDTYIDDYGKPDPIPLAMLRRMNQSKVLRLFEDDEEDEPKKPASDKTAHTSAEAEATPQAPADLPTAPDDHADLRLQQDDAAGRPGPDQGARA